MWGVCSGVGVAIRRRVAKSRDVITLFIFFAVAGCLHRGWPLVYRKELITLSEHEDMQAEDVDMTECPPELLELLNEKVENKSPSLEDKGVDITSFWGWWHASAAV